MINDIEFDSATDVTSIRYRLHPLDVGFDLRSAGLAVQIDDDGEPVRVSYADKRGQRRVMSGPYAAVVARLRAIGYEVHS